MVSPSTGAVVLVPFPFSDLSQSKLRPAVVLAAAGKGDFILCQITSKAFAAGSLRVTSYARPTKLFTANQRLLFSQAGELTKDALRQVIDAVVELLQKG